jgi:hypothetical protein
MLATLSLKLVIALAHSLEVLSLVDLTLCAQHSLYIRPILEYNSVVWNPCQKQLIDITENVQRNFTKRIQLTVVPFLLRTTCCAQFRTSRTSSTQVRPHILLQGFTQSHPVYASCCFNIYTPPESSRSNSPYLHKPTKASNALFSSFFVEVLMHGILYHPAFVTLLLP